MIARLCTICARGGSKGVKDKNIRLLNGIPLIAHTIRQAQASRLFDTIAVSSDSENILEVGKRFGADILITRPNVLASDAAAKVPAIQHTLNAVESMLGRSFQTIVDLDVTSPLRTVKDIVEAVGLLESRGVKNVLTGNVSRKSPYFNLVELNSQGVVIISKNLNDPVLRRQDSPKCYDLNGSVYVWERSALLAKPTIFNDDTMIYVMPESRSVDIDNEFDFELVEFLLQKQLVLDQGSNSISRSE